MIILDNIWLILFFLWGLPLTYYRSKFRKMVYQTDSCLINIQPRFGKELKGLFGNLFPEDKAYVKLRNFYRFYLLIYTLLFIAYISFNNANTQQDETMTKIEVGSKIPEFSLQDQHGDTIHISSFLGKKNMVIYFYPKDDTPGCTKEACYFQDMFEVFKEADAEVIGISGQSVESHKNFAKKHGLSFILLSDEGNTIRKRFKVPTNFLGLIPGRVTYVVDKTGTVVYMFSSQTEVNKHVDEALRIIQELEKK